MVKVNPYKFRLKLRYTFKIEKSFFFFLDMKIGHKLSGILADPHLFRIEEIL
jgi:hypothetical protein